MVEVVATDEFQGWFGGLGAKDAKAVARAVEMLHQLGLTLGFPQSSAIEGTKEFALRELRIQSGGRPLRVFYAFDPLRQAVLLVGGDKAGKKRFYETLVPLAEEIFGRYLAGLKKKQGSGNPN